MSLGVEFLNGMQNKDPTKLGYSLQNNYNEDKFLNDWGLNESLQVVDIGALQRKSLNLYRNNSIAGTIFGIFSRGVIGQGLTLKMSPEAALLKESPEEINKIRSEIMARWRLYSKRKISKCRRYDFNALTKQIFLSTMISGDCVVVIELDKNGEPMIQVVDGLYLSSNFLQVNSSNGNKVIDGVEYNNETGEIEAFYFLGENFVPFRYSARTPKGKKRAFLVQSHQSDFVGDLRGTPILAPVIQNIYEAGRSIESEQRAAYINSTLAVVHRKAPLQANRLDDPMSGANISIEDKPLSEGRFNKAKGIIGMVKANLENEEILESFKTERPNVNMAEFIRIVSDWIYTSAGIPPEVARMQYNSNYSASRQATMNWGDTCKIIVEKFSPQWINYVFTDWLDVRILKGEIKCQSYKNALLKGDRDVLDAWRNVFWLGVPDRNVDILKQAKALEIYKKNAWWTDEMVTEAVGGGNWGHNADVKIKEDEIYIPIDLRQKMAAEQPPTTTEENLQTNAIDED